MSTWPPTLADLKSDMGVTDDRDDDRLAMVLAAAVAFVQRVRPRFDYTGDALAGLPAPTDDLWLGTLRLAGRWHVRRRSPDALVQMADLGASRVPPFDADIERLIGIGRYAAAVFA